VKKLETISLGCHLLREDVSFIEQNDVAMWSVIWPAFKSSSSSLQYKNEMQAAEIS